MNEATDARTLSLSVSGTSTSGQSNVWILSGPDVAGPSVTLNSVGNGYPAGGPLPDSVPPYVVAIGGGAAMFDLPGSSVTSVVIY